MEKNEKGPLSYTIHKNSKWTKDLNIRLKTVELLEEKKCVGKKLLDIGNGHDFLDMTSKAQAAKPKIDLWDNIKLKIFCAAKEPINKKAAYRMVKYLQTIYVIKGQ